MQVSGKTITIAYLLSSQLISRGMALQLSLNGHVGNVKTCSFLITPVATCYGIESATSFADPALPYCICTAFYTGFIRNWVCLALDAHSHYSHAIFNALQQFSLL
jgi:hypothetical protein